MNSIKEQIVKLGIRCAVHLDDWCILGKTKAQATANSIDFIKILNHCGFKINLSKTVLEPTQNIRYVGRIYNTENMTISIEDSNMRKMMEELNWMLKIEVGKKISKNLLNSLLNKIMWNTLNNVGICRLLRQCRVFGRGHSYFEKDSEITEELLDLFKQLEVKLETVKEVYKINEWKEFFLSLTTN